MFKAKKSISCALTVVMLSALFATATVFAEGEDGSDVYVEPATDPVVYTTAAPAPEPEPEPEPVYTTAPPDPEPDPEPVYTTALPEPEPEPEPVYTTAVPEYTTAPYYDNNTEYVPPYTEYQQYTEYNEVPVYTEFENQQQFVQEEVTDPTEDQVKLYDTNHDENDYKELNNSNWKKIANELAAAQESDDNDTPSIFSKIKKKSVDEPESFWDNISWLLVSGIACFVLSAISLTVFIVMTVKNKKNKQLAAVAPSASAESSTDVTAEDTSSTHAGTEGKYYVPHDKRDSADYGDDYGADDKTSTVTLSEKTKRALKDAGMEDTAEIDINNIKGQL